MTAQVGERLVLESQELTMCTEPLECWFEQLRGQGGARPAFRTPHTALARGYVGRWGFYDVRLHLLGLQGRLEDGREVSPATFFPGARGPVFAQWFSGELRVPQGELLEYVHGGYGSVYERDLLLTVEQGVLVERRVRVNGKGRGTGREGYFVGAWTGVGR